MAERERELINRLTNLVEVATASIRNSQRSRTEDDANEEQGFKEDAALVGNEGVQHALRKLYPSINTNTRPSGATTNPGEAANQFDPRKSYRKWNKRRPRSVGKSTFSRPSANTSKMSRPTNQSQSEAITLKDIFLLTIQNVRKCLEELNENFTMRKNS